MDITKKIQELMKDEAFVKELLSKEEPEDVQVLFEDNGVDLSIDDIKMMGSILDKVASGEMAADDVERMANGELTEDELEDVAGGLISLGVMLTCAIIGGIAATGGTIYCIENPDQAQSAWDTTVNWFKSW